jgi:hypothetical protein
MLALNYLFDNFFYHSKNLEGDVGVVISDVATLRHSAS